MNAASALQADRDQIQRLVDALFRYANEGTFVSLRAFYDDAQQVFAIDAHQLSGNLDALVEDASSLATRAARASRPVVFAPPIATFGSATSAAEKDLANGLALSVESDGNPAAARAPLEALLGPATVVVASGGEWSNPDTGELEPKLHLHWRLDEPTSVPDGHADLKRARSLAMELVGADPSSKPAVHPMRWPGSWHRKGPPRLARIVSEADAEIDLQEALERLRDARGAGNNGDAADPRPEQEEGTGETRGTDALVSAILRGTDYHAPIAALAMRYLNGGMTDAQVVLTLRGMMDAVPIAVRDIKDGTIQTSMAGALRRYPTGSEHCAGQDRGGGVAAGTRRARNREIPPGPLHSRSAATPAVPAEAAHAARDGRHPLRPGGRRQVSHCTQHVPGCGGRWQRCYRSQAAWWRTKLRRLRRDPVPHARGRPR